MHARERQTDRRTDTGPQQRPRLSIASRGKNRLTFAKVMGTNRVSCFSYSRGITDSAVALHCGKAHVFWEMGKGEF